MIDLILSTLDGQITDSEGNHLPVYWQKHLGDRPTRYITFFEYNQNGNSYADNKEIQTRHSIQVDVWSNTYYDDIVKQVKEKLNNAGFTRISEADLYESDTERFHKAIRFFYFE